MAYNIQYNGNWGLSKPLITFNDIPNILKVESDAVTSPTIIRLFISSVDLTTNTTADGQWYIKIFGDTVTNVLQVGDAVNKSFYACNDAPSTIASLVRALRNCGNVIANFTVEQTVSNGTPCVLLTSRGGGNFIVDGWFETNMDEDYYNVVIDSEGYAPDNGVYIDVDVYSDENYITTLEKSYYGDGCSFDMSPVLATLVEEGRTVPYNLNISAYNPKSSTPYSPIGKVNTNYIVQGYMVNQGQKYLEFDRTQVAANYTRGKEREFTNNTILYTYFPKIDLSFYPYNQSRGELQIIYRDSAENVIYQETASWHNYSSNGNKMVDESYILSGANSGASFNSAYYIDLDFYSFKLRYNVVKPLKAAENAMRIYWRNSYGGLSFFDFTGQKSESRNLETKTYQRNIYDYYTGDNYHNELNVVYDNKVDYEVTLKSHLLEKDSIYIFNDLLQSASVWTEVNGETYAIIVKSVSVEETSQDNVYEATIKFEYSQEPSEIQ